VVAGAWALGPERRMRVLKALQSPRIATPWRFLSAPLPTLILHALVLWAWHIPVLFEAALANEGIHALQHASFFGTAAVFWWAVLRGRYGRAGYGLAAAFVFATAMHTSVLGALVTIASRTWYPAYVPRGTPWGIDALADQQLAGLIMWIPAGILLTLIALALFAAWLGESARRVSKVERGRAP
jgi:putative membrane protein